ncbi:hypothetical protein EV182_000298 [Spiromyces aspiralis]|uniref:Uncharacterized protein n=1 Tax=Spiromyces aspiralis TaxID=68401 RepID=A0ACC1HW57_9FUNG|nr:hypothetical protein EV182_000298 [Spiromyces aspiralis]
MGQYWRLVCWDKQQMTDDLGKLGGFFYGCSDHKFEFIIDALSLKRGRRGPLGRGAPIENLPVNILQGIISRLYGRDKKVFLQASRRIAGKIYEELYSGLSWQGCRIACIGDYTGKVPRRLPRAGVKVEVGDDESFYDYVENHFQEIDMDMTDEIRKAKMVERAMNGEEENPVKMVEWEMTGEEEDPTKFVVLNESRKEYVVTSRRNFTKVIISLICWSDDPSVSMNTDCEIYRGPWAWDRISILSQRQFGPVAAEFKDRTKRIYQHVRKIIKDDDRDEFYSE